MTAEAIAVLFLCFFVVFILFLADLLSSWRWKRFALECSLLLVAFGCLAATADFSQLSSSGQAFGSRDSPWGMIVLIFACTLIGMFSRYFFYLRNNFSWNAFLKPIFVSPIILLPLLGTLEDASQLKPMQIISFCILAFQNGFFWRVVFERTQSGLRRSE